MALHNDAKEFAELGVKHTKEMTTNVLRDILSIENEHLGFGVLLNIAKILVTVCLESPHVQNMEDVRSFIISELSEPFSEHGYTILRLE